LFGLVDLPIAPPPLLSWPVALLLPEVPGMLRWLCSCGVGAAFGWLSVPFGDTTEPPIALPVPVELPTCPVPVDVPVPVPAPDAAPLDDPAEPPLEPPELPPPEPPPWASAVAGMATAAKRSASVLSFIGFGPRVCVSLKGKYPQLPTFQ
jgi:hypothetical protein